MKRVLNKIAFESLQPFDGRMQLKIDHHGDIVMVNCPDEDDEIYINVAEVHDSQHGTGISLTLDEAEQLANYILGHVKCARHANPPEND